MATRSGLPVIAVLAIAGYMVYQFLAPTPELGPPPGQAARVSPADRDPASSYALRAQNTWPPLEGSGKELPVTDNLLAANYYVVLDGSGSMKDAACSGGKAKIEAARAALASFAASVPAGANLGLAVFESRGIGELLPLGAGNRQAFNQAVAQVQAGAGTPLRRAIEIAYGKLLEQGRRQLGYGEYHLVVVTDGIAGPDQDPTDTVNRMLAESPVLLSTIGFCIGEEHSLNQPGRTYYRAADNPEALRRGLEGVLAEAPAFDLKEFRN